MVHSGRLMVHSMVQFVLWMVHLTVHHLVFPLYLAWLRMALVAMRGLDAVLDGAQELGVLSTGVLDAGARGD